MNQWADALAVPPPDTGDMTEIIAYRIRQSTIRSFIEGHIIENGAMPTGHHDFGDVRSVGLHRSMTAHIGVIDFDKMAEPVAPR